MSKIYFSATTKGFYRQGVNEAFPPDIVEITRQQLQSLMDAQADGRTIAADELGFPVAIEHPKPPHDQLMAALRRQRDKLLSQSDFAEFSRRLTDEQRAAWLAYRDALFDLPETVADLTAIDWPTPPAF